MSEPITHPDDVLHEWRRRTLPVRTLLANIIDWHGRSGEDWPDHLTILGDPTELLCAMLENMADAGEEVGREVGAWWKQHGEPMRQAAEAHQKEGAR